MIKRKQFIAGVSIILGIGLITTSTIITIKMIQSSKEENNGNNNGGSDINTWKNMPNGFQKFSENNSFKVLFQCSDRNYNGSIFISQGTAWSWYYKQIGGATYDWYLMTNFHVVNDAVAYKNNLIKIVNDKIQITDTTQLINYYSKNWLTNVYSPGDNYHFTLSRNYNKPIITTNRFFGMDESYINQANVEKIDIITDFDNEDKKIFSEGKKYNLDMALLKIRINLPNHNNYFVPNVVDNYINNKSVVDTEFSPNKKTLIAGNPSKANSLVGISIPEGKWELNYNNLEINDAILRNLKAPYYYSFDNYKNFILTGGASGSAIYQVSNDLYEETSASNIIYFNTTTPLGIYWGGRSIGNSYFKPSFIPLVHHNTYNIFQNFIDTFITSVYNF